MKFPGSGKARLAPSSKASFLALLHYITVASTIYFTIIAIELLSLKQIVYSNYSLVFIIRVMVLGVAAGSYRFFVRLGCRGGLGLSWPGFFESLFLATFPLAILNLSSYLYVSYTEGLGIGEALARLKFLASSYHNPWFSSGCLGRCSYRCF